MHSSTDKLRAIMSGESDFPSTQFEQTYRRQKALLISAMRAREGRFNIDLAKASDMAWDMTEQMRDRPARTTTGGPDDPEPDEPSWRKTVAIAAVILLVELAIYLLIYQL